jgi:hypothetical protein
MPSPSSEPDGQGGLPAGELERVARLPNGSQELRGGATGLLPGHRRGEETEIALGRDGLRAIEIAHAAYRSSRDGATVTLDD